LTICSTGGKQNHGCLISGNCWSPVQLNGYPTLACAKPHRKSKPVCSQHLYFSHTIDHVKHVKQTMKQDSGNRYFVQSKITTKKKEKLIEENK
jgi:hypothetical protein